MTSMRMERKVGGYEGLVVGLIHERDDAGPDGIADFRGETAGVPARSDVFFPVVTVLAEEFDVFLGGFCFLGGTSDDHPETVCVREDQSVFLVDDLFLEAVSLIDEFPDCLAWMDRWLGVLGCGGGDLCYGITPGSRILDVSIARLSLGTW